MSSSVAFKKHSWTFATWGLCPTIPDVQLLIIMLACESTLCFNFNSCTAEKKQKKAIKMLRITPSNTSTSSALNPSEHLIQQLNIVLLFPVMTYPAESVQIGYQNHVEDIRSFLDSRHADHYTVFNLSQRNYRGAKFSNRVSEWDMLICFLLRYP